MPTGVHMTVNRFITFCKAKGIPGEFGDFPRLLEDFDNGLQDFQNTIPLLLLVQQL